MIVGFFARTIRPHRLSVRRANTKDGRHKNVLEARHQEQGRVLEIARRKFSIVVFGVVSLRWRIPTILAREY